MQSGKNDVQVTIKSLGVTQDASGEEIESYSTFATVWAEKKTPRTQERFTAEQRLAIRTCAFRFFYISGLTETMRVTAEGVDYQVTGVSSDQRENWAELACESIDPAASQ